MAAEVVNKRRTVVLQRLARGTGGRSAGPPKAIGGERPARHAALAVTTRGVLAIAPWPHADSATIKTTSRPRAENH